MYNMHHAHPDQGLCVAQAGAQNGNPTSDLSFCQTMPKQPSYIGQGLTISLLNSNCKKYGYMFWLHNSKI